ncbi:hypothetical protein PIB30_010388, partial [Stylosanthes scabra]|nr:hypothetical protein [Stylosanthes scabra]
KFVVLPLSFSDSVGRLSSCSFHCRSHSSRRDLGPLFVSLTPCSAAIVGRAHAGRRTLTDSNNNHLKLILVDNGAWISSKGVLSLD